MKLSYKIVTPYTKIEVKNEYFNECQKTNSVYIIVTMKRKYASIEWDLITLDNRNQVRKSVDDCQLAKNIRNAYNSYREKINFHKRNLYYQIQNCCGIIYVYKEDAEEMAQEVYGLVEKMLDSKCIKFETFEEHYKSIPKELRKYIGNKHVL